MHKQQPRRATFQVATVARMVAYMVAPLALAPAMLVNVDWTGASGWGWAAGNAGSIIFSAIFFVAARYSLDWITRFTLVAGGAFLIVVNTVVAFDNASHRSDDRSDHRRSAIIAAQKASSQRSQWSQGRNSAALIVADGGAIEAGEVPVATLQAERASAIASDARRWAATGECDASKITAGASMTFCAGIAKLDARIAAAKRRDELDAKIAALDAKREGQEIPAAADAFSEAIVSVLAIFNVNVSEEGRRSLVTLKDLLRSVALEVIAAMGPTAWLLAVDGIAAAFAAVAPLVPAMPRIDKPRLGPMVSTPPAPEKAVEPVKPEPPAEPQPVPLDDPFHKFVAECLEDFNGCRMPADEPWQIWQNWCKANGAPVGSQRKFGSKMKTRFAWESNNNRPRYLNLRAKQAAPALRVVASNG